MSQLTTVFDISIIIMIAYPYMLILNLARNTAEKKIYHTASRHRKCHERHEPARVKFSGLG